MEYSERLAELAEAHIWEMSSGVLRGKGGLAAQSVSAECRGSE